MSDEAKKKYDRLAKLVADREEAVRKYPWILKLEEEVRKCHAVRRELEEFLAPEVAQTEHQIRYESLSDLAMRRYEGIRAIARRWIEGAGR